MRIYLQRDTFSPRLITHAIFSADGETIPTWKCKIQTPPSIIDIGQIIIVEIYEPMKTLDRYFVRNKALLFEKITI